MSATWRSARVIATAAGRPYEAFVLEELLQPLRMSRTARLAALHCGGSASQTRVLSSQSIAAMAAISTRGKPYDLGLGWVRPRNDSGPHIEHFGGGMGYWNLMRANPQTSQGAVVMSNITRHWDITGFADDAMEAACPGSRPGDAAALRPTGIAA